MIFVIKLLDKRFKTGYINNTCSVKGEKLRWAGNLNKRRIVGFKSPPEHLIIIGDNMTIDHEINQLLVEIMTKEVLRRVKARLATLGVEVKEN